MIPKTGWRDMESAPKDGTIIFVVSHIYNKGENPRQVQCAQWLCDADCKNWDWRRPWSSGWKVYADGWMTVEEFYKAVQNVQPTDATLPPAEEPHHVKAAREIGDCFDDALDFDL